MHIIDIDIDVELLNHERTWIHIQIECLFLGSQLPNSGNLRHSESVPNVMVVMITNLSPNIKIWLVKTEMSP